MTLKTKLISTISAFVLILTIVIVTVWAATQANVSLGGTVNFQATNVYAKVTGTVTGMEDNPTLPTLIFSEGADASSEPDIEKWSNLDLLFNSSATPIEISVTVENLSTERWLLVDIIEGLDNGKSDNINKEVKKENSDYALGETHTLVPSTGEGTSKVEFTINLTVDDPNYSVNTVYDYIINLNNSNEAPPEPAKELDFTFSGNKVTGYTGNETNITIPTSYSMEKTPHNSFVLTMEELFGQPTPTPEFLNKMGMLFALKNYTVYLNGQSEGVFCENGFKDFRSLMENLTDPAVFPLRVELTEDLTFELTEAELEGEQETEETRFKFEALGLLQNFYVQFGENSEEILCQNYNDFVSKLNEIMPEGPKPEYFPLKFRIDYASYKFFEGDDYKVEAIGNFSLTPSTSEPVVLTIPSAISIDPLAFSGITHEFSVVFEEGRTEISDQAFMNCSALKGIVFPNSMQKIGERAFFGCTGITELTIPSNLTEIGLNAFDGCTSVTKLNYNAKQLKNENYKNSSGAYFGSKFASPEGFELIVGPNVEEIPMTIFAQSTNLTTVKFNSEKLSYVGGRAFYGCTNLQTNSYEGGIYLGKGTNPYYLLLTVEDKTVENFVIAETCEIIGGGEVLAGCTNLKSIVIPNSVTSICGEAFHNCSSLQTVTIGPESELEIIGPGAFVDCVELRAIDLPSKLKYIGSSAFSGCSSLTSITIPTSVVSINELFGYSLTEMFSSPGEDVSYELIVGINPFRGTSIERIVVEEGNKFFKSVDDKVLLSIDGKILYTYAAGDAAESYTIPSGVEIVGAGAFILSENLKTVVIPNGVKTIASSAFAESGITSITIPESVDKIGVAAFADCKSLVSVYFGEGSNIQNIYGYSFYGCDSLKEISLPDTIKTIGEYAIANCPSIDTLIFKNDIEFGKRAFQGSEAITVILSSRLTTIPDIFSGGLQVLNIIIEENSKITTIENQMFWGCTELQTFIVKENSSLTTIGSSAFWGCSSLTSITIPEGVTSIGNSAFYKCSSLSSITIPKGVTLIDYYAFYECSSLTSVSLPSTLTSIGNSAFYECSSLTSVSLPTTLTSIGGAAFQDCTSLTEITIPKGVTSIGGSAFDGCSSLNSITIPEGVTSIGESTFSSCSSLTSVSLPSTLTSIGSSVFYDCSSLEGFYGNGNSYYKIADGGRALLVDGGETLYAYAIGNAETSYEIPEGVTSIGNEAFSGCSNLTLITIPEGVTSIESYAFQGCISLTSIILPSTLTSIGDQAFWGCSGLTEIEIPEGVISIGNNAFIYCSSLTKISIPEGVVEIGYNVFQGCSSLTTITIPEGVTEIRSGAFWDCSSLTSVTLPSTLTSIGSSAFSSCYALAIVYNNSSLNIIAGSSNYGEVGYYAKEVVSSGGDAAGKIETEGNVQYYVNSTTGENIALAPSVSRDSLTSITIRKGTTEINQYAFQYCNSLTSAILPSISEIGYRAFYFCRSLTEITINGNITNLDMYSFSGCDNLTKLTLGKDVTDLPVFLFTYTYDNLTKLTEIVVEEGSSLSEVLPGYGKWVKDGGSKTVTIFSGAGTYTRTDV